MTNKKIGRPTSDPKVKRLEIRLTDSQNEMLEYCVRKSNLNRTEVLIQGLEMVNDKLSNK